jgi:prepilin-type processing-associated H-X9-DG protein
MPEELQPRLSRIAVAACILGLSSLVFSVVTGFPALFAGLWAVRAVNRSDGRLRGRTAALIGLIVSAGTTLLTIIGVGALVLLVLQDKSQRAECTNDLRQIGQAINAYRDSHEGKFPSGTVRNARLPPEKRLSWQPAIMTHLAAGTPAGKKWQTIAGGVAFDDAWDAPSNVGPRQTNVPVFLCPAFRSLTSEHTGLTSYVGIAGVGVDAAHYSRDDSQAGFFGYDRVLEAADISSGTSKTMMVVETTQDNGLWLAGGTPTVRGLDPSVESYIGSGRSFGGLHRDGLNVLWADGSVRLVNERMAPLEFRASARIHRDAGE